MRNLYLLIVAVLILLVLTISCPYPDQKPFPYGITSSSEKVKLTMYAYQDLSDLITYQNWKKLLSAFQIANPDIELQIEYGFYEPYHLRLQEMVVTEKLPDIVFLWPDKRTNLVTGNGLVKDLRPFLTGKEGDFCPAALIAQGQDGEIYELPEQVTATHVMFVNHKLLNDLGLTMPQTMAELIAQGNIIRANGLIPIAMDNKDAWPMQSCLAGALVERMCGMEWFKKAIVGTAKFTDPEFIAAMKVISDLAAAGMFPPGINEAPYGTALTDFINEDAVYLIDGGWRINNMISELTPAQKEYITLEVFPAIPGERNPGTTSTVSGTGYGMNAKLTGVKAEAAWRWIWFYTGPEGSKIRATFGALPSYKIELNSADIMLKKLIAFLARTPGGYVIDTVMDSEGMGIFNPLLQELIRGNKTPEDVGREYEIWVAANESSREPY